MGLGKTFRDEKWQPVSPKKGAGYDWSALLREGGRTIRTQAIAETWYEGANRGSIWTSDQECQKDWGSKWIPNDTFDDACYDRTADPDFTTRIESPKLASELNTWREGALVRYGAFRGTGDAAPEATVEEQLEALGYAQ